jgi:hypothetical protein
MHGERICEKQCSRDMSGLSVGVDYMFDEADQPRRRAAITDYEMKQNKNKDKDVAVDRCGRRDVVRQ